MHVPYNGSTEVLRGVVTGQVAFAFAPLPAVISLPAGDKIRLLALAARERHPVVADLPTLAEAGVGMIDFEGWFGVFAPRGVSPANVERLNRAINDGLRDEVSQQELLALGLFPQRQSAAMFAARIVQDQARAREIARWSAAHSAGR